MDYKIVAMDEKKMVGFSARTDNNDPAMGEIIGGLWQKLFADGVITAIAGRVNECTIGLYSDYEEGVNGKYDITTGCEINMAETEVPQGMTVKTIPAGNYAKFTIVGDMVQAVGQAWGEIWGMDLKRTYAGDYEEYVAVKENGDCEINIYIAVE